MKIFKTFNHSLFDLPKIAHKQILFTSLATLFFYFLSYLPDFPFDSRLRLVALFSGMTHLFMFVLGKLQKLRYGHLLFINFVNIITMGFAMHFSGGVASPFVGIFVCILVAGTATEIHHPMVLPLVLGTYIITIALEYFDLIKSVPVNATAIYSNIWVTLIVILTVSGFIIMSSKFYELVMKSVKTKVESEQAQKQQLLKKMGNLEASSHVGMMVAKIAHDINSPLTAIGGFLQIMQDDDSFSKKVREDFEIMFRETKRISAMIDKMLKYVKPGTEIKEPVCPKDVVETVMAVLQFHPLAKGIQFVKDYQFRDGVQIMGNKQSLQQVYFNIAKNALEAMNGRKGKNILTVTMCHDDGKCYINIADNGHGMSQELLEKVKQGFFTTKEGGTGLGLSVTQEIISGHQGEFDIQSEPGKGTKILTSIPIYNPTAPVMSPSPSLESVV